MRTKPLVILVATGLISILGLQAATAQTPEEGQKKKRKKKTQEQSQENTGTSAPAGALRQAEDRILGYDATAAHAVLDPLVELNDPKVAMALGRVLTLEGNYGEASAKLTQAATQLAADPEPMIHLGETYVYAKRPADADAAFQQAAQRAQAVLVGKPGDAEALYNLGVAQARLKQYDQAIQSLEQARTARPADAMTLFQLGVTRARRQEWAPAVDLLTQALDKNAGIAYGYYYRGLAADKLGRKDLLISDMDRFLALAPTAPEAEGARRILAAARR